PVEGHRILIVDDNRDSATTLATLLRLTGHETSEAYDGPQALAAADEFRPDVVLLDIGLPGLDGYSVCRRLRAEPWGRDMLIIAVSGWGKPEDQRRSAAAGFDHHMVKPIKHDALTALLGGSAARQGKAAG
ncbi:MAG TPA: response regulator, partial [Woeseiaceae bacterium]